MHELGRCDNVKKRQKDLNTNILFRLCICDKMYRRKNTKNDEIQRIRFALFKDEKIH